LRFLSLHRMISALIILLIVSGVGAIQLDPIKASRDEARTEIDRAEEALLTAYRKVLEAEASGADVTTLVDESNSALDLLCNARESYDSGDYASALEYSSRSIQISRRVASDAEELKAEAERVAQIQTTALFIGVPLVILVVIAAGYRGFQIIRRRRVEEIMKKRVRVVEEEVEE